jgi:phosphatidylserine decarboxylase
MKDESKQTMKPFFVLLQYILPHHLISRVSGKFMNIKWSPMKDRIIPWFIKRYKVDMSEAKIQDITQFKTFNDFFTRELKPGARPIAAGSTIISPADGCISQMGDIKGNQIFQAKGQDYSLSSLLGGEKESAQRFENGSFATIYLSPKDYHRVHMPITGRLKEMIYVPGRIFSVNPLTADHVPGLFARNERVICLFETELGTVAVILVGAMIVASIHTVWHGQVTPGIRKTIQTWRYDDKKIELSKGEELGYFCLGSTVIMLFPASKIDWSANLESNKAIRLGEKIAEIRKKQQ